MRHIECIVDEWPINGETRKRGERAFTDDEAARIMVGMGKFKYVDDAELGPYRTRRMPEDEPGLSPRAMTTDDAEALLEPKRGRYNRRDMRAKR